MKRRGFLKSIIGVGAIFGVVDRVVASPSVDVRHELDAVQRGFDAMPPLSDKVKTSWLPPDRADKVDCLGKRGYAIGEIEIDGSSYRLIHVYAPNAKIDGEIARSSVVVDLLWRVARERASGVEDHFLLRRDMKADVDRAVARVMGADGRWYSRILGYERYLGV